MFKDNVTYKAVFTIRLSVITFVGLPNIYLLSLFLLLCLKGKTGKNEEKYEAAFKWPVLQAEWFEYDLDPPIKC